MSDRYRKRPVVIEAMRFAAYTEGFGPEPWNNNTPSPLWRWMTDGGASFRMVASMVDPGPAYLLIETLEGEMRAEVGDWIIRGVAGEFYPVKPDIFAATYEPAEDPDE